MLKTEAVTHKNANLPPEDIAAEEALLGGILLDENAIATISDLLEPRDFYTDRGKKIYEAMTEIASEGIHPDVVTVASRLKAKDHLVSTGGQQHLEQLRDRVLTASNAPAYSAMIHEKSKRRALISYSSKLAHLAHDTVKPLEEVVQQAESELFAVTQSINTRKARTAKSVMADVKARFVQVCKDGIPPGLKTGFSDFDQMTQGGLQPKDLWVFCGRPSSGKTAFAINVGQQVAEAYQKPVQIFSLEMGDEQLVSRLWSSCSRVESRYVRSGRVSTKQYQQLEDAEDRIERMPIFIDEQPKLTLQQISSRSRQTMAEHGPLGAIVIDYIQLMGGVADNDRVRGMGAIARGLKQLAKELDVPVIALSQITRGVESRTNKRPTMSDLRDSGEIEEAADLIAGLYREEYYDADTVEKGIAEVIILKQRNGETGTVKLLFEPEFTQFRDLNGDLPEAPKRKPLDIEPAPELTEYLSEPEESEWESF